jgi:hypothetical protein
VSFLSLDEMEMGADFFCCRLSAEKRVEHNSFKEKTRFEEFERF